MYTVTARAVVAVNTCFMGYREESDSADGSLGYSPGMWDMVAQGSNRVTQLDSLQEDTETPFFFPPRIPLSFPQFN